MRPVGVDGAARARLGSELRGAAETPSGIPTRVSRFHRQGSVRGPGFGWSIEGWEGHTTGPRLSPRHDVLKARSVIGCNIWAVSNRCRAVDDTIETTCYLSTQPMSRWKNEIAPAARSSKRAQQPRRRAADANTPDPHTPDPHSRATAEHTGHQRRSHSTIGVRSKKRSKARFFFVFFVFAKISASRSSNYFGKKAQQKNRFL